ncbi:MAG: ATP-grasp domain-containing protein, partial [Phycisphaerales bacterium]|nr:ATP-grasp domain-containing protein [Phycisphaerales bacterium]
MTAVLILGGGPDAERQVSIASATAVHQACLDAGLNAKLLIVDEPTTEEIAAWQTDVIFPVLHGTFGEGGQLQQRIQAAGQPFVGAKAQAARIAMDKMATKLLAATLGIPTKPAALLDPAAITNPTQAVHPIDPPLDLPIVIKPVAEGSSFGLYLCPNLQSWHAALQTIAQSDHQSIYMIEPLIDGKELTIGVIDNGSGGLRALPTIEIAPASGTYDYQAKYERADTVYTVNPDLADDLVSDLQDWSLSLCQSIGVRHLARVDFMLDHQGTPWLLEANTMPGFTKTSLLPKAA